MAMEYQGSNTDVRLAFSAFAFLSRAFWASLSFSSSKKRGRY